MLVNKRDPNSELLLDICSGVELERRTLSEVRPFNMIPSKCRLMCVSTSPHSPTNCCFLPQLAVLHRLPPISHGGVFWPMHTAVLSVSLKHVRELRDGNPSVEAAVRKWLLKPCIKLAGRVARDTASMCHAKGEYPRRAPYRVLAHFRVPQGSSLYCLQAWTMFHKDRTMAFCVSMSWTPLSKRERTKRLLHAWRIDDRAVRFCTRP